MSGRLAELKAWIREAENEFVWIAGYDGDLDWDDAVQMYYESPRRGALSVDPMSMIDEVKGLAPLRGYRNLPKGDLSALAEALVKLSALANAERPPVDAEINPLIVGAEGEGGAAVDGLVIFGKD